MVIKRLIILFSLCAILFYSACASNRTTFKKALLAGMVYDYDNNPCSGATVYINGKLGPVTDISGRFTISNASSGTYKINVKKDGYEDLSDIFDFKYKTQVLYLKIISKEQLYKKIELALGKKQYSKVESLIIRAEKINKEDPVFMYLKSIYLLKRKRIKEAEKLLLKIIENDFEEAAVYLTLADIYEYKMDNPLKAISYLKDYLSVKDDADVKKRLDDLRSNIKLKNLRRY